MDALPTAKNGYNGKGAGAAYLLTHSSALLQTYLKKYRLIARKIVGGTPKDLLQSRVTILGCGNGVLESCILIELAKRRIAHSINQDMNVRLIDINRKFLCQAREEIFRQLAKHSTVNFELVCGDFVNPVFFETGEKEIILMLGCTFGNLGSEEGKFLAALNSLAQGSLLAIDMQRRKTRSSDQEKIRKVEPICAGVTTDEHRAWFQEILRGKTQQRGVADATFLGEPTTESFGGIPGGYRIVANAIMGEQKISLLSFGRYGRNAVVRSFENDGWYSVWRTTKDGYHTFVFVKG